MEVVWEEGKVELVLRGVEGTTGLVGSVTWTTGTLCTLDTSASSSGCSWAVAGLVAGEDGV